MANPWDNDAVVSAPWENDKPVAESKGIIASAWDGVKSAASNVADGVASDVKSLYSSPSSVMENLDQKNPTPLNEQGTSNPALGPMRKDYVDSVRAKTLPDQIDQAKTDPQAAKIAAQTLARSKQPDTLSMTNQDISDHAERMLHGDAAPTDLYGNTEMQKVDDTPYQLTKEDVDHLMKSGATLEMSSGSTIKDITANAMGGLLTTGAKSVAAFSDAVGADDMAAKADAYAKHVNEIMQENGGSSVSGKAASIVGAITSVLALPELALAHVAANAGLFAIPAFRDTLNEKLAEGNSYGNALSHAVASFGVNMLLPTVATKGSGAAAKLFGAAEKDSLGQTVITATGAKGAAAQLGSAAAEGVGFSLASHGIDKGIDFVSGQKNDSQLDSKDLLANAIAFVALRGQQARKQYNGSALHDQIANEINSVNLADDSQSVALNRLKLDPNSITPQETVKPLLAAPLVNSVAPTVATDTLSKLNAIRPSPADQMSSLLSPEQRASLEQAKSEVVAKQKIDSITSAPDIDTAIAAAKEAVIAPIEQNTNPAREGYTPASWVLREKATGKVIAETFDPQKVAALNTDKYEAVPINEHLGSLSSHIAESTQAIDAAKAKAQEAADLAEHNRMGEVVSREQLPIDSPMTVNKNQVTQGMHDLFAAHDAITGTKTVIVDKLPGHADGMMVGKDGTIYIHKDASINPIDVFNHEVSHVTDQILGDSATIKLADDAVTSSMTPEAKARYAMYYHGGELPENIKGILTTEQLAQAEKGSLTKKNAKGEWVNDLKLTPEQSNKIADIFHNKDGKGTAYIQELRADLRAHAVKDSGYWKTFKDSLIQHFGEEKANGIFTNLANAFKATLEKYQEAYKNKPSFAIKQLVNNHQEIYNAIAKADAEATNVREVVKVKAEKKQAEAAARKELIDGLQEKTNKELRGIAANHPRVYLKNAAAELVAKRDADLRLSKSIAAKDQLKKSSSVNPNVDSMADAIAKLGGINRESVAQRLQLSPEELNAKGQVGFRAAPLFHKYGMNIERMAERLAELGYIHMDEGGKHDQHDFEDKLMEVANGVEVHTPNAMMLRAQAEHEHAMQEVGVESKGDFEHVEDRGDAVQDAVEGKRDPLDDSDIAFFDHEIENKTTAQNMRDLGFSEEEIKNELAREEESNARREAEISHSDEGISQDTTGRTGDGSERDEAPYSLQGESADEANARLEKEDRQAYEDRQSEQEQHNRAQADKEVGNFGLTGSDRSADRNDGQNNLFSPKREDYKWETVTETENGPEFSNKHFLLLPTHVDNTFDAKWFLGGREYAESNAHHYWVFDKNNQKVANLSLEIAHGKIEKLLSIEVEPTLKGKGIGRDVVGSLLANDNYLPDHAGQGTGYDDLLASTDKYLKVFDILKQSEPFWKKVGADELNADNNGQTNWSSFERGQARREDAPRQGGIGEGNAESGEPGTIKSGPRPDASGSENEVKYSPKREETWHYSQLSKSIEEAPDRVFGAPKQVAMWLDSNAGKLGVKKDEIQWTGVTDWLNMQTGKVSKADVLDYLRSGGVQVHEVMKGEDQYRYFVKDMQKKYGDSWVGDLSDAEKKKKEDFFNSSNELGQTKYEQYQLPGGDNYRELLLTLPKNQVLPEGYSVIDNPSSAQNARKFIVIDGDNNRLGSGNTKEEALQTYFNHHQSGDMYKSTHWDEKNILAHIRFNDRTDTEGNKVLFIEELQSDWGQEGLKKGFNSPDDYEKTLADLKARYHAAPDDSPQQDSLRRQLEDMVLSDNKKGVPSAPFVTKTESWLQLGIKRMTAYAVEHGYDKVAFVNGEQSSSRYDLTKHIDEISYLKKPDGSIATISATKDGSFVFDKHNIDMDEVEATFGKEIAKKIESSEGHSDNRGRKVLEGVDLKVGGEGMKTFYDKIVPQNINDALKKIGGGRVEGVDIGVPNEIKYSVEEYRGPTATLEQVKLVLDVASKPGSVWESPITGERQDGVVSRIANENPLKRIVKSMENGSSFEDAMAEFPSDSVAKIFGGKLIDATPPPKIETSSQNGFTITDAMRDKVSQGLPLFSPKRQTETPEFKKWFGDSKVVDDEGKPLVVYHGTGENFNEFSLDKMGSFSNADSAKGGFFFTDSKPLAEQFKQEAQRKNLNYGDIRKKLNNLDDAEFKNLATDAGLKLDLEIEGKEFVIDSMIDRLERDNDTSFIDDRTNIDRDIKRYIGKDAFEKGNVVNAYLSINNPMEVVVDSGSEFDEDLINSSIKKAKLGGYDGLVIKGMLDSAASDDRGNNQISSNVYIAFTPTQIKSATGENRKFDASNPDIRFSPRRDMPDVIIGNPLGELANHAEYEKAKAGDTISAIHTVRDLVTPEFTEKIKQEIGNKEVILQPVMATESSGDNQIPAAMVVKLSEELGHQVGETIYQSTSPKRTGLSGLDRIFNRPEFDGEVEQGKSYFLVDDTVTQGGTFAALSDHIERNGGHVIGSATLTGKQYSAKISLSDKTLGNIREKHGDIEQQFKSSKGYGFDALTESEARYLANYKPTDTIRSRILAEEQSSHHDDGKNGLPQRKIESKFSPQREAQDEFAPRNEGVTPENSASKVKGMLSKILRVPAEFIKSPLDRIGTAVIPMSMGSESAQVVATKFADAGRQARQQWNKFDEIIVKEFTKEQQEKMWDAADQENDLRRDGVTSQDKGLNSLEPRERQVVEFLHAYGEHLLKRATDNGMFDGEGVAYWTPRMVMLVDADGRLHMPQSGGPFEGSKDARNLRTNASSLKQRKYLTSAETEAAAQGMNEEGKTATIVRNIRTMPMAMARLESAVAGRELVNQVKAIGESTGVDAVSEYKAGDKNYFTMDHPALRKTSVEMIEDPDTGKMRARLDENGDVITKRVPLYISKEFEGPLRAVLNRESLPGYQAIMNLKSKSMGLIMMSPAIHLAVEYGRSAPAMLTSVSKADAGKNLATLGIYTFVVGHQAKQNDAIMKDFIAHGLVPLGGRGFNADINGIADGSSMEVGKSWTAKALGSAVDLINKQAGDKVRAGVDKAGDFWHGTLLWNRIADLQMGLAVTIKTSLINKGLDEYTATTLASHMANRYAGALPAEAMGQYAREIANTVMFSRSFTLGNMGLMKDMVNGLPPNRQAMIKAAAVEAAKAIGKADAEANKSGDDTLSQAKKIAKSKARQTVVLDIALAYAANAIVQAYFENEETHKTWADQLDKFGERFNELKSKSLIDIVSHPFTSLESLTPQGHNPEGHRNRARLGDDKDGSTIYVRVPFGKVGEELEAYSSLSTAAKLLGSKLSPMVSGGFQAITGKDNFDHSIYGDHDAAGIQIGKAAWHFMKAQIPYDQLVAFKDIAAGKADDIDKKKALGPFVGLTYSKVTGGDELAEEYKVMRDFQDRKVNAMPDVKRALKEGDEDKARELLIDIGMSPKEAIGAINRAQNPSKPMSTGSYKKMYQHATEDQKQSIDEIK